MDDVGLRVGDAERLAVIERLAEHFRAGRLTADELEERTALAQASVTRGDLMMIERDLPPLAARAARAPAPARSAGWDRHLCGQVHALPRPHGRGRPAPVRVFAVVIAALWCIWLLTGAGYPWPVWPMLGWGVPVALGTLGRPAPGGSPHRPRRP